MTKKQQAAMDAAMKTAMQLVVDIVHAEKTARTSKPWDRLTIVTEMKIAARELNKAAKIIAASR